MFRICVGSISFALQVAHSFIWRRRLAHSFHIHMGGCLIALQVAQLVLEAQLVAQSFFASFSCFDASHRMGGVCPVPSIRSFFQYNPH